MSSEAAQEIYEYARRGKLVDLQDVIHVAHPDEFVGYDGSTAFLMACKNGHREVCEILIKHGADLSLRTDEGSTALLLAASVGCVDLMSLLISHRKCDINETNEDGLTALDIAVYYNHTHVVELLKSHGGVSSGIPTPEVGEVNAGPSEKWGYGVFDQ